MSAKLKKGKEDLEIKNQEDQDTFIVPQDVFWTSLKNLDTRISTGSLIFDIFLDGGYSPGVVRFGGPPSHGKTMQCLEWASRWLDTFQEKGRIVYYDTEGRLTVRKITGCSNLMKHISTEEGEKKFVIRRLNVYETVADQIIEMIENNPNELRYFFVFDSLDMMRSIHDDGKKMEDSSKIGGSATVSNKLMQKLGPNLCAYGHHFHILSQIRSNVNTGGYGGKSTKMSGGNTLKHAADIIGEIHKSWSEYYFYENPAATKLEDKGKIIGQYFRVTFEKTPNDKDGETISIPIKRGHGIWKEREVADCLIAFGFVQKSAACYKLIDTELLSEILKIDPSFPEGSIRGQEAYYSVFTPEVAELIEKKLRGIFIKK